MNNSLSAPQDQADTLRNMDNAVTSENKQESATRVYAITSGKGGVGKTAVVANTAAAMAKLGKKQSLLILCFIIQIAS